MPIWWASREAQKRDAHIAGSPKGIVDIKREAKSVRSIEEIKNEAKRIRS